MLMPTGPTRGPFSKDKAMIHATTRRRFIEILPLSGAALMAACSPKPEPAPPPPPASAPAPEPAPAPAAPAPAAASEPAPAAPPAAQPAPAAPAAPQGNLPKVDPKDAQALALGYVDNAAQADKAKFKTYAAGSQCGNCSLYQGKAGDAEGGCPLFPGKQVAAKGWCSAWVKKA